MTAAQARAPGDAAQRRILPLRARPPKIGEILFPTDFSPESGRAFEHARLLAEAFEAHLTLYHVVPMPRREYGTWAVAAPDEAWSEARRAAWKTLNARAGGLAVRHRVVVELALSAARALVGYVRAEQPDLTVMATHGREGLAHLLLGSVTETVLLHGRRPLLCVRKPLHGEALPYRRILVPTDLSPASRLAFPMAGLLARRFGAQVLAVHVLPLSPLPNMSGLPLQWTMWVPSPTDLAGFLAPAFREVELTPRIERGCPVLVV